MTRILYLLSFVFITVHVARSQDYIPMVIQDAHWIIHSWESNGTRETYALVIREDTLVDGVQYHKLNKQDLFPDDIFGPFEILGESLQGFIREDTMMRKVYYIQVEPYKWGSRCEGETEDLIYDFNAALGDTMTHCGIDDYGDYPFTIDTIGTVNVYGKERKTWVTYASNSQEPTATLVEGIGYHRGLLAMGTNLFYTADHSVWLWGYCQGTDWECGLLSTISELDLSQEISMSPNPVIDQLHIHNRSNKTILKIKIISMDGSILLDVSADHSIDLSSLNAGVYIVNLSLEDGYYALQKIIKH